MNAKNVAALALLSGVYAEITTEASIVAAQASILNDKVSSFSSAQGINGALGIQATYPTLSDAVVSLNSDLDSATSDQIDTAYAQVLLSLTTNVSALLNNLAGKAADFSSVGAGTIVSGDVTGLYGPSISIASKLISLASGKCDLLSSVTPGLSSLDAAFSAAATAYSFSATAFPTAAACEASSSSESSSSAASSTESSSSAASSSESSSSAASSSESSSSAASSTESSSSAASSTESSSSEASSSEASSSAASTTTSAPAVSSGYRCRVPASGTNSAYTTTIAQA